MSYQYFAEQYFELGLKPTCISYLKTKYNISEKNPEKSPCHSWRRWQVRNPLKEEIIDLPWKTAIGIGTALGFTNRCIDIDNCSDENILSDALNILGLPKDYEWAVKTPKGYHIHIESNWALPFITNKELNEGVLSLKSNEEFKNKLSRIELRWANHSVLPPTKLNGYSYSFINVDFPSKAPSTVSVYNIFLLITKYCGTYHKDIHGEIGKVKINKLLFECIYASHSYYPEISVFDASQIEDRLIAECDSGKTIRTVIGYNEDKLLSEFDGSRYYQNISPLFIDIETTGLIKDYLDYKSYPHVIQISYTYGRNSEIFSYYIKPDGFSIPKEIENLTGISQDILLKEGVTFDKALLKLLFRGENIPIVCHNADFDISVLDVEHLRFMEKASKDPLAARWGNPFRNGCQIYCTMKKYSQFFGGKYPKLTEMYESLFKDEPPKGMHNALIDVEILKDCFYLMNLYGYNKFVSSKGIIEDV
ncbi:exonuclease domain-containing protein [Gelidibacter japonicus]|uniref:exonuclease domain-containing protein n=1 Tax=Gelidibacter japonicus TaxID=1962232 RepID=UPI0019632099|nr:exonuclease domain-containing protein [Gelidibacter japonicus]